MIKLTHSQAYVLNSISRHADKYRREVESLNISVQHGLKDGVRQGIHLEAAMKADYASKMVDELLDNFEELFDPDVIDSSEIARIAHLAMSPTENGIFRRRFEEDQEL